MHTDEFDLVVDRTIKNAVMWMCLIVGRPTALMGVLGVLTDITNLFLLGGTVNFLSSMATNIALLSGICLLLAARKLRLQTTTAHAKK